MENLYTGAESGKLVHDNLQSPASFKMSDISFPGNRTSMTSLIDGSQSPMSSNSSESLN
jgi:hypothetical protein